MKKELKETRPGFELTMLTMLDLNSQCKHTKMGKLIITSFMLRLEHYITLSSKRNMSVCLKALKKENLVKAVISLFH